MGVSLGAYSGIPCGGGVGKENGGCPEVGAGGAFALGLLCVDGLLVEDLLELAGGLNSTEGIAEST